MTYCRCPPDELIFFLDEFRSSTSCFCCSFCVLQEKYIVSNSCSPWHLPAVSDQRLQCGGIEADVSSWWPSLGADRLSAESNDEVRRVSEWSHGEVCPAEEKPGTGVCTGEWGMIWTLACQEKGKDKVHETVSVCTSSGPHSQSISLVRTVRLPWSASHRLWAIVEKRNDQRSWICCH